MAPDKKNKNDSKKSFPTTFFLFLLAIILIVITLQNFLSTKTAKVAFSYQVQHLVNLQLIIPEESRKVSQNDNLVTFSGKFREHLTEEGKKRYKFLELLEKNHVLKNEQNEILGNLAHLDTNVREAAKWFLEISGTPIPEGGYRVVEEAYDLPDRENAIIVRELPEKEMINLKMMQERLQRIKRGATDDLSAFESDLTALIANFRSPVLGIGAESMKQELKTLSKEVD